MFSLIIKLLLLIFGLLLIPETGSSALTTSALLAAVFCTSMCQYFRSRLFTLICALTYFGLGTAFEPFCLFVPPLCVDVMSQDWDRVVFLALLPISVNSAELGATNSFFLALLVALAVFMQYLEAKIFFLEGDNKNIRDTGTEQSRILEQKNRDLSLRQADAVNLAKLRERNRIAREIHDNVGHALSRSIMQVGALQAISRDETLSEPLNQLQDTLANAMGSIRNSVHDLWDESTDLYGSISQMLSQMTFETHLDYDVSKSVPGNVQACIISVLREALTNTTKHSDADRISVTVREHPAFFQLLIQDNGTKKAALRSGGGVGRIRGGGNGGNTIGARGSGMGLVNMEDRVRALGGNFSAHWQDGFRIFLTIPKPEHND